MIDAAALLTDRLAGSRLTSVTRYEYNWGFGFAENAGLSVECPWRILTDGRIAHASSDDGQQFGLPAPIDGEEAVRRLLGEKVIRQIRIRSDTADLTVDFGGQTMLEVITMSAGYESWQINAADLTVIGLGGGELGISVDPRNA